MRLTTWNVNGLRNPFSYQPWNTARSFPAMFDILGSDIVVMQELKIQRKDLKDDMVLLDGWDCYFSLPRHKKGYSGVAIYTRNASCAPVKAEEGLLGILPSPFGTPYCELPANESIGGYLTESQRAEFSMDLGALDAEGRCVILEFPAFVLLGVYTPANSNGLRDDFRHSFIRLLDYRVRNLIKNGKRVVLVGDLNVSRDELDAASAMDDLKKSGMTHEEYISTPNRRIFNQMLVGGEVVGKRDRDRETGVLWDTTRAFHPGRKGMYTHWEQKVNARPGNYGGRIDFILVAECMQSWVQDANIQEGLHGSDHCPVYADFKEAVMCDGKEVSFLDLMNPKGVSESGLRHTDWQKTTTPAFSARLLPEFDKRRSIKSMFSAPTANSRAVQVSTESQNLFHLGRTISTISPRDSHQDTSNQNSNTPSPSSSKYHSTGISLSKRKITTPGNKPSKRQDLGTQTGTKGQKTLTGFFQLTADPLEKSSEVHSQHLMRNDLSSASNPVAQYDPTELRSSSKPQPCSERHTARKSQAQDGTGDHEAIPQAALNSRSVSPSPSMVESQVATAEENQRSWGSLFARPIAPLCESHNEPCKTMQTKKKGSNQGRSFWMCARPLGPSGNKERGTQWRCPTFIWCSDWDGKR